MIATKQKQEAEWMDAKAIYSKFTLGRTVLCRLATEGKIKTCSLQDVGKNRGKRLYEVSSIRSLLNSMIDSGGEASA